MAIAGLSDRAVVEGWRFLMGVSADRRQSLCGFLYAPLGDGV